MRYALYARQAPLAQSAERLHGKYLARIAVLTRKNAVQSRPVWNQLDALEYVGSLGPGDVTQVTHLEGVGLLRLVVGALFRVAPKKGEGTLLPTEISSTCRRTARPHSVTRPAARQAACHSIGHAAGSGPDGAVGEAEEAVEGAVRQDAVDQQERAGPAAHGVPSPGAGALDGPGDGVGDGRWLGRGPGVARTQHAADEGRL